MAVINNFLHTTLLLFFLTPISEFPNVPESILSRYHGNHVLEQELSFIWISPKIFDSSSFLNSKQSYLVYQELAIQNLTVLIKN